MVVSPTGPAPITATVEPGSISAIWAPQWPVATMVDVDRDDGFRFEQAGAHHGGEPHRPGADHGHRRTRLDLGDLGAPVARRHDVTQKERVLVGHARGDGHARMVRMGNAHKLGLAAVRATAELPTALHAVVDPAALAVEALAAERLAAHGHTVAGLESAHALPHLLDHAHELVAEAVVDPAALAVEALAAERLAAHGHTVAGLESAHALPHLLDHAHELVAEHRVGRGARNGAVNDVQVTRADGRARDADDGVGWRLQLRLGAILERDMSAERRRE